MMFCLCADAAFAQAPVFDVHVHLREGESSLREYEADVIAAKIELVGFGAMWFGAATILPMKRTAP